MEFFGIQELEKNTLLSTLFVGGGGDYFNGLTSDGKNTASVGRAVNALRKGSSSVKHIPHTLTPTNSNLHFLSIAGSIAKSISTDPASYVCFDKLRKVCDNKVLFSQAFSILRIIVLKVSEMLLSKLPNKRSLGCDGVSSYLVKI